MNYKTFSGFSQGYAHVKNDTSCEDYAVSFVDPGKKYYIGAVCDGHSDCNCFRSAKGAKFGCEAAAEILSRFLELYDTQNDEYCEIMPEEEERLKRSVKQCWERKVFSDLEKNPVTREEMEPLSEHVRKIYEEGKGLLHIYGATLLAFAVSEKLFIALHIGDGMLICVDRDGMYLEPLPEDEKSGTGSPASLCDADLFARKGAFRSMCSADLPLAVFASSDGIGDSMDKMQFRELLRSLAEKFESMEEDGSASGELNERQKSYLESCLRYWADKGNGAEDDCSLAGIYRAGETVPEVKIPLAMAKGMWDDLAAERERVIQDYGSRKKGIRRSLEELERRQGRNVSDNTAQEMERLRQILFHMERNEAEKLKYIDARIKACAKYADRICNAPVKDVQVCDARTLRARAGGAQIHDILAIDAGTEGGIASDGTSAVPENESFMTVAGRSQEKGVENDEWTKTE